MKLQICRKIGGLRVIILSRDTQSQEEEYMSKQMHVWVLCNVQKEQKRVKKTNAYEKV